MLVSGGADVSASQDTPLFTACFGGHGEVVEAVIYATNDEKRTVLHASDNKGRTGVVSMLVKKNAGVNVQDDMGLTPLHLASCQGHSGVVSMHM